MLLHQVDEFPKLVNEATDKNLSWVRREEILMQYQKHTGVS